jgi:hypothetical protein
MNSRMRDLTIGEIQSVAGGGFGPGGSVNIAGSVIEAIGDLDGCTIGPTPVVSGPGQVTDDGPIGLSCGNMFSTTMHSPIRSAGGR